MLETPKLRRRFVEPLRQFGLLAALISIPVIVFLVSGDQSARRSVTNVVISFFTLMLAFRLIGKRELGRLSPFELVTLMLIPEILSNTVQGQQSLGQGVAGLCTVLALVLLVSLLSQRLPGLQTALESSPTVLVLDGRMLEREMNRERIAPEELFGEMRRQGLSDLRQVHLAVLESSGSISLVPRPEAKSEG